MCCTQALLVHNYKWFNIFWTLHLSGELAEPSVHKTKHSCTATHLLATVAKLTIHDETFTPCSHLPRCEN